MEFDEEIREFLIESDENLANLDREIVLLEEKPHDPQLISSAFRTIHTIKGTCGFFGYTTLGLVAHGTENLLSQVREGEREFTPELISLVLEAIDSIKGLLATITATGAEGHDLTAPLRARLEAAHRLGIDNKAPTDKSLSPFASPAAVMGSAFAAAETSATKALPEVLSHLGPLQKQAASADQALRTSSASADTMKENSRDAQLADSSIRVDVALLDRLMNLVGELVLARNQLLQETTSHSPAMQQTSQRLNLITSELQEGVMKTRMQPIGVVWNKLPRIVRDLAAQCGKKIGIKMEGAGTELDKTIIEAIKDPLTHIVRNCCDHGIETTETRIGRGKHPEGLLLLRAYHEGGVVNIEISDDGAGINVERVKAKAVEKGLLRSEQAAVMSDRNAMHLIFLPGFSTAAQITSISGRGVGMDVVKTNIEKIGGSVEVLNRMESGTTIRIRIPLTLAIIPGLVVSLDGAQKEKPDNTCGEMDSPSLDIPLQIKPLRMLKGGREERFIIPQANLLELVCLDGVEDKKQISDVHGTPVFYHRGKLLPLIDLRRVLGRAPHATSDMPVNIVVVQAEQRQLGLIVDHICDTQEIVVKPLGRQLKGLACYVGATIMGDGRAALILDVAGLARLAGFAAQPQPVVADVTIAPADMHPAQMFLLFRAGRFERLAVPLILVDRLEEISTSRIERAAGRAVLCYRDEILPLLSLSSVLAPGYRDAESIAERVQIVVVRQGSKRLGLIVDQIIDIVSEVVSKLHPTTEHGLLGSSLIGGRITDLIDLPTLASSVSEPWVPTAMDVLAPASAATNITEIAA